MHDLNIPKDVLPVSEIDPVAARRARLAEMMRLEAVAKTVSGEIRDKLETMRSDENLSHLAQNIEEQIQHLGTGVAMSGPDYFHRLLAKLAKDENTHPLLYIGIANFAEKTDIELTQQEKELIWPPLFEGEIAPRAASAPDRKEVIEMFAAVAREIDFLAQNAEFSDKADKHRSMIRVYHQHPDTPAGSIPPKIRLKAANMLYELSAHYEEDPNVTQDLTSFLRAYLRSGVYKRERHIGFRRTIDTALQTICDRLGATYPEELAAKNYIMPKEDANESLQPSSAITEESPTRTELIALRDYIARHIREERHTRENERKAIDHVVEKALSTEGIRLPPALARLVERPSEQEGWRRALVPASNDDEPAESLHRS